MKCARHYKTRPQFKTTKYACHFKIKMDAKYKDNQKTLIAKITYNIKKTYNIFSIHISHKILGKALKQAIFVKIIQYMEIQLYNILICENFSLISKLTINIQN